MSDTFYSLFDNAPKIDFSPEWIIEHRYLNGAVTGITSPVLKPGVIVSTVDTFGRKCVIIGVGNKENIIIFERYANNKECILLSNESFEFFSLVKEETTLDISNVITEIHLLAIYETISKHTPNLDEKIFGVEPWC
jgi:hypothetical protein